MIDAMEHYQQYVPVKHDGTPIATLFYGDGLSCERATSAQDGRWGAASEWGRLEGLEPAVQEWHLRMHILEVTALIYLVGMT